MAITNSGTVLDMTETADVYTASLKASCIVVHNVDAVNDGIGQINTGGGVKIMSINLPPAPLAIGDSLSTLIIPGPLDLRDGITNTFTSGTIHLTIFLM